MSLVIVGCGLGPENLTAGMRQRIAAAGVLAGGRRLLEWFAGTAAERIELGAGARRQAAGLLLRAESEVVVVLASGDPLFFGIAGTFLEVAEEAGSQVEIEIIPNVSALQVACARARIGWHRLAFFNLHGGRGQIPWRSILRAPGGALLLAGPGERNPGRLAAALSCEFPEAENRKAILFSNLGTKDEVVHRSTLGLLREREWPALSLLYLAPAERSREIPGPACGLPVDDFAHEGGLITKPEVRAVILAKLALVPGILWDLGAGSGSVAVEAAFQQPGLRVWAVEKSCSRSALVRVNAQKHGVAEVVEVINGDMLATLGRLPDPDRVFIGGGGEDLGAVAEAAFRRLAPGGRMVAAAVTLESRSVLNGVFSGGDCEVLEINIARDQRLGGRRLLKSENPVALYSFRKELD